MRKGNKQNAGLNGEWGFHMRKFRKKITATIRRTKQKIIIKKEQENE